MIGDKLINKSKPIYLCLMPEGFLEGKKYITKV